LFPILANISIFWELGDRHVCITLKIKRDRRQMESFLTFAQEELLEEFLDK